MKTLIKVIILVIFLSLLGLNEYFQGMKFASMQRQLNGIQKNQQKMIFELNTIKSQQATTLTKVKPTTDTIDYHKVYQIDIANSSFKGNKDAKITIVEFSDFQCPYSQRTHPVIEQVINAYPDKVRFVFKNFPLSFHPLARPAAKATFAARQQGKYWEMVDAIFKEGKNLSQQKFTELAKRIGLNVKKFSNDLKQKDTQWEELIEEDISSAKKAQVRGTPTFFINGRFFPGRSFEEFKVAIEQILKE